MRRALLVLALCGAGLTTRALVSIALVPKVERAANIGSDPDHYGELAASLIDRHELGFDPPGALPTSLRGPGFPAWLAIGALVGRSPQWLGLWASLPGLLAAGIAALMLDRSHGRIAAVAGGLAASVHPLSCFVSARILPDEYYGAFLFVGLVAWTAAMNSKRTSAAIGWSVATGAALAVASLTRITALGALPFLVIAGLKAGLRARASLLILFGVTLLPVGAWAARTSALSGRFTIVESLPGYNFWLGEADDRFGFAQDFAEWRRRALALMTSEAGTAQTASPSFWYATLSPAEAAPFDAKLAAAARRLIAREPLRFAGRFARGLFWFWVRGESIGRTLQYSAVAIPFLVLGAIGLVSLIRDRRPSLVSPIVIMSSVVLHVVLYAAICPMARYSVQLYPLMSYLLGVGASVLYARVGPVRRGFRTQRLRS